MATAEIETRPETEEERVVAWRAEALLRAGYKNGSALELAIRSDVDLHFATNLVRSGCPVETALRILR